MAVGDEVFGIAPGCFGPSVVVPEQLMVPKPPTISFEEAATTPTVYVTVYAAFGDLSTFNPSTKASHNPYLKPIKLARSCHGVRVIGLEIRKCDQHQTRRIRKAAGALGSCF